MEKLLFPAVFTFVLLCGPTKLQHEDFVLIGDVKTKKLLQIPTPEFGPPLVVEPTQEEIDAATPEVEPSAKVPPRPLRI